MKLTKSQQDELVIWEYFSPKATKWQDKNLEDIKKFFEWSEKGKHKDLARINTFLPEGQTYFHKLVWGKKWAGIHVHEMYEPSILDGSTCYFTLLGGLENNKKWWQFWKSPHKPIPEQVVRFLKKEMFKGEDKDIIDRMYKQLSK